jgi:hypothetical protein
MNLQQLPLGSTTLYFYTFEQLLHFKRRRWPTFAELLQQMFFFAFMAAVEFYMGYQSLQISFLHGLR